MFLNGVQFPFLSKIIYPPLSLSITCRDITQYCAEEEPWDGGRRRGERRVKTKKLAGEEIGSKDDGREDGEGESREGKTE